MLGEERADGSVLSPGCQFARAFRACVLVVCRLIARELQNDRAYCVGPEPLNARCDDLLVFRVGLPAGYVGPSCSTKGC